MIKPILLASAMAISTPALAQEATKPGMTPMPSTQTQTVPATPPVETPAETVTPAADSTTATAQTPTTATDGAQAQTAPVAAAQPAPQTPVATTPAPAQEAAATTPAAPAAASATQIAQVVNTEFPSYDKDSNGDLSKAEFGTWMVALKTASDPSTKAADASTQTWVGNAFASADTDKSSAVSKDELTKFLSQGVS